MALLFSNLNNKIIDDDKMIRIVIEQHPSLQNGPVELQAAAGEVEAIRTGVLNIGRLQALQVMGQLLKLSQWRLKRSTNSRVFACVTWIATSLGQRARQQLAAPLVARR
jgi:hypothetical protein